ncbi:helix-turn-helix domain-containing protein [Streptosporangium canum]|uniref:helix-turn-helix transcriptional regulator n=1 Tax=Streptosporangium canum TaxID=324952 RepID=UPI003437D934
MTLDDRLWGVVETSHFLRVPVATLYQWRHLGTGPESHKVGRHIRYLPEDVVAWVRRQP